MKKTVFTLALALSVVATTTLTSWAAGFGEANALSFLAQPQPLLISLSPPGEDTPAEETQLQDQNPFSETDEFVKSNEIEEQGEALTTTGDQDPTVTHRESPVDENPFAPVPDSEKESPDGAEIPPAAK